MSLSCFQVLLSPAPLKAKQTILRGSMHKSTDAHSLVHSPKKRIMHPVSLPQIVVYTNVVHSMFKASFVCRAQRCHWLSSAELRLSSARTSLRLVDLDVGPVVPDSKPLCHVRIVRLHRCPCFCCSLRCLSLPLQCCLLYTAGIVFPPQSGIETPFFILRFTSMRPHLSSHCSSSVLKMTFHGSSKASNLSHESVPVGPSTI